MGEHSGGQRDSAKDAHRETYKALDFALRVGELLMSSGAGAADVNATMWSVVHACGLRYVEVDVTFTALTVSYQPSVDEPATVQVRHVRHREIDYEDLTLVDHLVQDLILGTVDLAEARSRLARIVSSGHRLPRWAVTVGYGVMGAGVALLLGGNAEVIAIAFLAAVGIDLLQRSMTRRRWPGFYQQVAGGMLATLLAVTAAATDLSVDPSQVVTASIVMLLAGIGFMGAVQDALTGFPLTAGARILEAMLATAGIIAGVSGGLTLGTMLGVDLGALLQFAPQAASETVYKILESAVANATTTEELDRNPLVVSKAMVDEVVLSNYLERREFARGLPADPREFAEDMVRDGVWQGELLLR